MDATYLKQIVNEMHNELVQRERTYKNLIVSGKMTKNEANHRYICLQNAKWLIEAELKGEPPKIPTDRQKTRLEIAEELETEIKWRKKVYRGLVFHGNMTKFEMERRIGYFEFAYTLLAPPVEKEVTHNIQTSLF